MYFTKPKLSLSLSTLNIININWNNIIDNLFYVKSSPRQHFSILI